MERMRSDNKSDGRVKNKILVFNLYFHLALSDLLFNVSLLVRIFHDMFFKQSLQLCRAISFLSNLAEILSAMYTVSFTIQRFIAVHNPLQAASQRQSSPFISLGIIFIFSSIFSMMLVNQAEMVKCREDLIVNWFIADALISFVIPFSLIIIFNILIVNMIRKNSRSQISVQTIFLRRRIPESRVFRASQRDETLISDNNTNIHSCANHQHQAELVPFQTKSQRTPPNKTKECVQTSSFSSVRLTIRKVWHAVILTLSLSTSLDDANWTSRQWFYSIIAFLWIIAETFPFDWRRHISNQDYHFNKIFHHHD